MKTNEPARYAKMVKYQKNGNRAIKIKFSSLDKQAFYDDLERIKTLSGRRFHNEGEKYWTCPLTIESAEKLQEWGFHLDEHLIKFLKQIIERKIWFKTC